MSQKSWEGRMTTFAMEASAGLRELAEPVAAGDRVKRQIERAARAAGLSYWRAFDIWYGKARRVDARELEAIRAAKVRRTEDCAHELSAIAADFDALAERLARMASRGGGPSNLEVGALAGRVRRLADGVGR